MDDELNDAVAASSDNDISDIGGKKVPQGVKFPVIQSPTLSRTIHQDGKKER
jgi:hypothetical protein